MWLAGTHFPVSIPTQIKGNILSTVLVEVQNMIVNAFIRIGPDRAYPLHFTRPQLLLLLLLLPVLPVLRFFSVFGPYPLKLSNFFFFTFRKLFLWNNVWKMNFAVVWICWNVCMYTQNLDQDYFNIKNLGQSIVKWLYMHFFEKIVKS